MTDDTTFSAPGTSPVLRCAFGAAIALTCSLVQAAPVGDSKAIRITEDTGYALVQLQGEALTVAEKTKPAPGKKVDFNNGTTKSYRAQLSALRNNYKAWLRASVPAASISGEFDISLNAVGVKLNGATLAQVAAMPLVRSAQYQGVYYRNAVDPDLAIIKAPDAWTQAGGFPGDGAGVKVAIIDSGIDASHPCFAETGYDAQQQQGDRTYTNNKVIVARVFNNKSPSQKYTPQAVDSHGTHVAGTVACNFETPTTVDGVVLPYKMSGVAPKALLGNYNVFPGSVDDARSEDILNALEAAYADGFDVANMSLGGGARGVQDLVTVAVDNLDRGNMVVTISSGNEGPGYRTVGSPGSAARGLTAGASAVGHRIVFKLSVGAATFIGIKGEFGPGPATGPLRVLLDANSPYNGLSQACAPFATGSLTGAIALVTRGTCDFVVKVRNVQAAGGIGAIVVNREPGLLVMGTDELPNQPTIPAFLVDQADAGALKAANGASTTLPKFGEYEFDSAGNDVIADFTSWGPTDVAFRVKPDVMAPGVNVVSSIPRSYCNGDPCFAFFNGTSMAAPHLAGSAAVVRGQHAGWTSDQVRSAIVNTADRKVVKALDNPAVIIDDANKVGTGRENLLAAVNAKMALDPVSVSFGAVPSGSGATLRSDVKLTNISNYLQQVNLAVVDPEGTGVVYALSARRVTLQPQASTIVTVTLSAQKGAAAGGKQAVLRLTDDGGTGIANAMLYTLIK
jgi:subtilisin family serine protease